MTVTPKSFLRGTPLSRVFGVKAVADEIKVRLPDYNKWSDEDLGRSAANAIAWNVNVPKDCVKVVVKDGWITLTGEVNWQYERCAAKDAVHHLRGLQGVKRDRREANYGKARRDG